MQRRTSLFTLVAAAAVVALPGWASEGVDEVSKLAKAGLSQDVLMAFVQAAPESYDPTADEIKALRDDGVSASVIVAMIDHGKELSSGSSAATAPLAQSSPSDPQAQPVNQPIDPSSSSADFNADAGSSSSGITSTMVAPPPQDANISYFYETMAPHGTWHETSIGHVWRPNVVTVQTNWQPYANDGHWIWTDAGWYWESSYPWGWAAFHYGRWNHDASLGWVWLPDTTWGPSWVSWRHSDSYYGWAPLPVDVRFDAETGLRFHDKHVDVNFEFGLGERDYAFVPADRFLDVNIGVALLGRDHVSDAYRRTTVINNTYVYNDNRVINSGVPQAEVAQRTHRNLETVRITEANFAAGTAVRGEVRSRNTISVFRPTLANAAPRDPAAAIARGTYVRRDVVYRHVTRDTDRNAEQRLTTELVKRSTRREEAPERTVVNRDDAAQRRLDQELAQRERAKSDHGRNQEAVRDRDQRDVKEERDVKTETVLRNNARQAEELKQRELVADRRNERANQAHEDAAARKESRDDGKSSKKHGHDE